MSTSVTASARAIVRGMPSSRTPDLPEILTAPEVAQQTGVAISTICRHARAGRLPYLRKLPGLRGAYLFSRDVLDTLSR